MATYESNKEIVRTVDSDGKEISSTETTHEKIRGRVGEPDYIKLYTNVWCEYNEIPTAYRNLFLELAIRMSYTNASDLGHSQIVFTGRPTSTAICECLGWKEAMYQKGLKALCECKAIKRINRGVYQINPSYAGRGQWRYNSKLNQGGVEQLIATFNFTKGTVNTSIVWADDEDADNIHQTINGKLEK